MNIVYVMLGGALGAAGRYGLSSAWVNTPNAFPWATFVTNLLGCFAMGWVASKWPHTEESAGAIRLFLATGFLGGFTTFSTFGLESLQMLKNDQFVQLGLYTVGSVVLGVLLAAAGYKLAS